MKLSREQFELARDRVARLGLESQITLLLEDYRDLRGAYDGLVSIEMREAVGHQSEVRALGYPESFLRMWEYYLCYCAGGFEERQLGDVQMLLIKPRSRAPIVTVNAATA